MDILGMVFNYTKTLEGVLGVIYIDFIWLQHHHYGNKVLRYSELVSSIP